MLFLQPNEVRICYVKLHLITVLLVMASYSTCCDRLSPHVFRRNLVHVDNLNSPVVSIVFTTYITTPWVVFESPG